MQGVASISRAASPQASRSSLLPPQGTPRKRLRRNLIIGALAIGVMNLWVWGLLHDDVLDAAYSFPDGGGYCSLSDSGVHQTIKHRGSVILPASKRGSYCCGFTFEVAMKVAQSRGLLGDKSATQVRQMQQEWYGSEKGSEWRQCVLAMERLGVGREVKQKEARTGDFVTFHRSTGVGHSVVFLNWVRDRSGQIAGFRYRSSQGSSGGVSDKIEYFQDSGLGDILRDRCYVGRLNRQWWSRLLYPV
jgi:hypothetical protein